MILYDKSGMFLGMGVQELSLLGYDDMEEFRNYHNDIADLFINKSGYIFKFKNFSWIDYTLHSGTPNKRVLIKTKNGREIDVAVQIYEIFLTQDLYGEKSCFGVEFVSSSPFAKAEIPVVSSAPQEPNVQSFDPLPTEETSADFIIEDAPTTSFKEEASVPVMASPSENSFEIKSYVKTEDPLDDMSDFKLKVDSDVSNQPSLTLDTLFAQEQETFSPSTPFLEEESLPETYSEDTQENPLKDTPLLSEEDLHNAFEAKESAIQTQKHTAVFDFSLSAETLGLDIGTLAEIITEYIEELDTKIPLISKALEEKNIAYVKEESDKLKRVASHLHILPLYEALEALEGQLDLALTPSLSPVYHVISDLKDSLEC